ncbi:DUF6817 domain-containing protein [Blastococcus atacamensis]|uniref:DUF6817 domain-containing protein n=1 Tax=Blastococcus atacamensis TaxID=2070508 RepID=UPI000CECABDB|nr:hypothetical protein [Blastococcus atacamensis]
MDSTDRLAALLRDRGAEGIDHPGGTLYGHAQPVQHRLAALGLPRQVQLAGRAHAVYGTQGFDVRLLGDDERPLLIGIVGPAAEELVHRYGACDRDRTWPELPTARRVHDRHTGAATELDDQQLRDFADLSLVTEIDVAEHGPPGFLDEHGGYFRRLTEEWAPVLSPEVVAAARRAFG